MTYLIIAVVVLYLVGTITWVMPSRRDKKQAAMRARAKQLGLQLQYKTKELPRGLDRGYGAVAYMQYIQPRPQPLEGATVLKLLRIPEEEGQIPGWTVSGAFMDEFLAPFEAVLAGFPADVFGVLVGPGAVAIEWQEKGDLDDIERIYNGLSRLLTLPLVELER
ncbi:hypothetical protein [Aestuariirhabdus litorea]|uniref:Preprotein translocase subunit YajC n=1 Tax=Aestuariirhabdus litorea TaxID=2528527 RepID=A0A3P3VPF9_9GAMM|nr:hypothetical protein [Aestuariirhabdus litorea]RRJ84652.1 hypothetical protein D0544_05995 [Aestuariirhabdus litorea]RWW97876.1 hypothetical protein DZC74_05990 [Endozoicomonadaceae bacterium GTF-13]